MSETKSYLQERVYDKLGLTPEQCAVPLFLYRGKPAIHAVRKYKDKNGKECVEWLKDKDGNYKAAPFPLFQSDQYDNIRMFPYSLSGYLLLYDMDKQPKYNAETEPTTQIYCITRMNPSYLEANPGKPKYKFPGGETKKGTYPFFPPNLYDKFCRSEHIETIVLTEGYMKAMAASVRGMDVVGLGSITLYADSKTKQLYPDIVKLLNTCKPDNIVILYDGDCRDLGKDALADIHHGTVADLSKRPQMFRSALLKLRELLLEFRNEDGHPCELYFAYVNKMREIDPPKGLDDLLVDEEFRGDTDKIADDLNHPGRPGVYFKKLNLRTGLNKISALFNLKSPEKFYEEWEDLIDPVPENGTDPIKRQRHQFKYEGSIYQYSVEEKKLLQMLDSNLDDYVAIGGEIMLVTEEPITNANGTEWKFYTIPDKVINARYGEKTAQKIYRHKYYTDFTICPDHENFKKEIVNASGYKFYNMYSPLPYEPESGSWTHIDKLLHQITKVYGENYYQMLLDWITLTYIKPLQFLPIIMLVSKERGTGKTSFLNLLKYIYGRNAVIGGNDLIVSKFNSLLGGKLIAGVDESCLGDNKEVGESLKYMSTSKTMHVESKGKDKKEMPAFIKFVLCSNEVKKCIFISNDEIRFWVMRLTPWEDEQYDTNFDDEIEGEIPAFLDFIKDRYYKGNMFVPKKEHRMWFHPSRLVNDDLKKMISGTQSNFEGSLRDFLENMFLDTERLKLDFDVSYIKENIPDAAKKDEQYIRTLLSEMAGVTKNENGKYKMPFRVTQKMKDSNCPPDEDVGEVKWPTKGKQCRPYTFDAKYFLDPDEYNDLAAKVKKHKQELPSPDEKSEPVQTELPMDDQPNASASKAAAGTNSSALEPDGSPERPF